MKNIFWISLCLFAMGCATGKMGKITKELDRTQVTKETLIAVLPVTTNNITFDGDKAHETQRTTEEKQRISENFHKIIVSELRRRGFNPMVGDTKKKGAVILKGNVKFFDHGSAAARAMVGMGAGSSNMFTDFELIRRDDNTTLTKFEIIATSGGRGGFSAMGSFMDAHLLDGAEKAAEYITGIKD